jgi:hypothetical protein
MDRLLFILLLLLFPIDSSSKYFHAYQNYWLMPKEAFVCDNNCFIQILIEILFRKITTQIMTAN